MVTLGVATNRSLAFTLALGVLGGAALVSTVALTARGPMIFVPYAAVILVAGCYLRLERVQPFRRRLGLVLGAFMTATLILYAFIFTFGNATVNSISLVGHVWRLGLMLGVGAVLSAAVAQLTATKSL